jgi:hypothetical protein
LSHCRRPENNVNYTPHAKIFEIEVADLNEIYYMVCTIFFIDEALLRNVVKFDLDEV